MDSVICIIKKSSMISRFLFNCIQKFWEKSSTLECRAVMRWRYQCDNIKSVVQFPLMEGFQFLNVEKLCCRRNFKSFTWKFNPNTLNFESNTWEFSFSFKTALFGSCTINVNSSCKNQNESWNHLFILFEVSNVLIKLLWYI